MARAGRQGTLRAFVALEIGSDLREALGRLIEGWRRLLPVARFVRPEAIHLTLRFLGGTTAEVLERLEAPLAEAAAACPPTEAPVVGVGLFPDRGSPRVLWVGLAVPASIGTLQEACETAAVAAGFAPEGRAFRPHLTLARFRDRVPRPRLPAVTLGPARLTRLTLFLSELRPSGAVYTPLSTFPLGGR